MPDGKHKCKDKGKKLTGWWEPICSENKKSERQEAKKDIRLEIRKL